MMVKKYKLYCSVDLISCNQSFCEWYVLSHSLWQFAILRHLSRGRECCRLTILSFKFCNTQVSTKSQAVTLRAWEISAARWYKSSMSFFGTTIPMSSRMLLRLRPFDSTKFTSICVLPSSPLCCCAAELLWCHKKYPIIPCISIMQVNLASFSELCLSVIYPPASKI